MKTVFLHGFGGRKEGIADFARLYCGDNSEPILINLPGFKSEDKLSLVQSTDIYLYAKEVMRLIDEEVRGSDFELVGHSHGAMIAFVLTSEYPERICKLMLLCPVVKPQLPVELFAKALLTLSKATDNKRTIDFLKNKIVVDAASLYSVSPLWRPEDWYRIIKLRRDESKHYQAPMLSMIAQVNDFFAKASKCRVKVPTVILVAKDDTVTGRKDFEWFVTRINSSVKILHTLGGHLVPVATPQKVVTLIRKNT